MVLFFAHFILEFVMDEMFVVVVHGLSKRLELFLRLELTFWWVEEGLLGHELSRITIVSQVQSKVKSCLVCFF